MSEPATSKTYPPLISLSGHDPKPPYGFTPANDEQLAYITATEPNVFLWGNRGGGKSVTARWTFHALAMAYPGYRYGMLRTSFPELTKNHLIYLDAEMKALGGDYHATKYIARYPNGSMGFYMQAETEEQVRNALGVEMHGVCFDEAPTFRWEHMIMIAASVRVAPDSGLVPIKRYLGNPIGPSIDDLFKYFVDKDVDPLEDPGYRPDEWRSIKIDLEDNPHLDVEAYKKQLGTGLPEHIRKAWLDGEKFDYGQLFEVIKTKLDADGNPQPYHVIHELPRFGDGRPVISYDYDAGRWVMPEWVQVYRSYDHGYFPDAAVCLWFAVIGKQTVCFKERVWYRAIAKDIARDIVDESKGMRVITTYCDPTLHIKTGADVQTIKDTFELHGVPMDVSVNNREHYAHALNSALKTEVEPGKPRFQMYGPGCPYLVKSLPQMRYDEKNPLAMADHRHDHAPIAAAYYWMSHVQMTQEREAHRRHKWLQPKHADRYALGRHNIRRR